MQGYHTGGKQMKVHIKYYAKYVEYAGAKIEDLEVERMSISDLLEVLKDRHPRLKEEKMSIVALNGRFGNEKTLISDGDTISVFPPVSGG